jgi:diguanylate cyclase (GGDEF)-like protein
MTDTTSGTSPPTLGSSWTTYVGLFRALLPRASGINLYDERGELLWATDLSKSREISVMVARKMAHATAHPEMPGHSQLIGSTATYLFWIRRNEAAGNTAPIATVAVRLRSGGNFESCSLGFVHQIVKPAIDCLRRDLLALEEIERLRSSQLQPQHSLSMLQAVSANSVQASPDGAEDLKSILAGATRHMQSVMTALIVPDKSLVLMHAAENSTFDRRVLAKMHRHLLSLAKMRREPIIVNCMPMPANEPSTFRLLAAPICRPDGQPIGVMALFRPDSSAEFTAYCAQVMELLARRVATVIAYDYDALTGLLTRPAFERRMRQALQAAKSTSDAWSALYLNVDRMSAINEANGMHNGDRILSQLGGLVRRQLPPGAIAARDAADRFSILLPVALDEALKAAERLRQSAEQLGSGSGSDKLPISISLGVAPVPSDCKDLGHVFALAETACKAAKAQGPNRVELYQEANESIVRRMTDLRLVANLRTAIEENSLQMAAQLVVPLGTRGGVAHFELLLRMINEKGKRVGPSQFMSSALRYELLPQVDRWVIQRVTQLLKPHGAQLMQDPVVFSINLSSQSLRDPAFASDVEAIIAKSAVNPMALCFELTEDAMMTNLPSAESFMRRVGKLGCGIALDDFGTGLSSLAHLRSLPIGTLKIDGSFVRDVLTDPKADAIVQTIVQLGRSMSLVTVAKHIETDEVCERMTALGVDYGQGFTIAAPAPLEKILSELPLYASRAGAFDARGARKVAQH